MPNRAYINVIEFFEDIIKNGEKHLLNKEVGRKILEEKNKKRVKNIK